MFFTSNSCPKWNCPWIRTFAEDDDVYGQEPLFYVTFKVRQLPRFISVCPQENLHVDTWRS